MARPQNSARGFLAKARAAITTLVSTTLTATTAKATTLQLGAAQEQQVTVDGTGYLFRTSVVALPASKAIAAQNVRVVFGTNSTGHFAGINTTGTTHLFLSGTTIQPTT